MKIVEYIQNLFAVDPVGAVYFVVISMILMIGMLIFAIEILKDFGKYIYSKRVSYQYKQNKYKITRWTE